MGASPSLTIGSMNFFIDLPSPLIDYESPYSKDFVAHLHGRCYHADAVASGSCAATAVKVVRGETGLDGSFGSHGNSVVLGVAGAIISVWWKSQVDPPHSQRTPGPGRPNVRDDGNGHG